MRRDIKQPISQFPSEFVSVKEKSDKKWLREYAKAVNNKHGYFAFDTITGNREKIIKNRKYAAGTQDPDKYRTKIEGEENFAQLNLFINTSNPIGTFVNNVVGQLQNQGYKPRVRALSPESKTKYDDDLQQRKARNFIAKNAERIKAAGGDPGKYIKSTQIFQSDEELELHFEMNFKDDASLALEIALQYIFDLNHFPTIERKVLRDLVVAGWGCLRIESFSNGQLVIRCPDVANLVTSHITQDNACDAVYVGEYKQVSINQLAVMANGELSEEDLFNAAQASKSFSTSEWQWGSVYYPNMIDGGRPWGNFKVNILDLTLKSTNSIKMKEVVNERAGGFKMIEVEERYEPKSKEKIHSAVVENRYKIKYVCGTEICFDYGLDPCSYEKLDNGKISSNADLGYIIYAPDIYDMQNSCIVDNLIGLADDYIFIKLNVMRMIAEAHPAGVAFNMDSIAAAVNGFGEGAIKPRQFIDMFYKKGTFGYVNKINGRDIGDQNPIREIPETQLTALAAMQAEMQSIIKQMEIVSGVPFATVGEPDKDYAVGNAKIALLNRNNSLRYIDLAYRDILKRASNMVMLYVQDQIEQGSKLDEFGQAIGYGNIDAIQAMKRIPAERFGIEVEVQPDIAEQNAVIEGLKLAVGRGAIKPSDVAFVQSQLKISPERARRYLALKESQYAREEEEKAMRLSEYSAKANADAGVSVEREKQRTAAIESQARIHEMHVKYKLESGKSHQDYMEDMKIAALEGALKLEQIEMAMNQNNTRDNEESRYDQVNLPRAAGVRMPSVVPK